MLKSLLLSIHSFLATNAGFSFIMFTFAWISQLLFVGVYSGYLRYNLLVVWLCLPVPATWLAGKIVSEMTYNVSSGTLNPILSIYTVSQKSSHL